MQVLAVFILYVRCAGCDPADPGVHQSKRSARAKQAALKAKEKSVASNDAGVDLSHDESDKNSQTVMTIRSETSSPDQNFCAQWLCLPFVCCRKEDSIKLNSGEQLLYLQHLRCICVVFCTISCNLTICNPILDSLEVLTGQSINDPVIIQILIYCTCTGWLS